MKTTLRAPTPTPLSQQEIDATKEEVIKRINALPNISPAAKERLIEKLDRARSMERLTVIPFDIGRTVLTEPLPKDWCKRSIALQCATS